jgi:hypothetical protein
LEAECEGPDEGVDGGHGGGDERCKNGAVEVMDYLGHISICVLGLRVERSTTKAPIALFSHGSSESPSWAGRVFIM